jgi:hypothetical protein
MLTGAPASPASTLVPESTSSTVASSAVDGAGVEENGIGPTTNGETNVAADNDNEATSRELIRLKQQVAQLQDEKAECLAALTDAHTHLAGLQQQGRSTTTEE